MAVTSELESPLGVRWRLSIMMALQYAIWGVWWVPLGTYLAAIGFDQIIGQVYATQGYAAIAAPLIFGVIADRYIRPEKLLVILHLVGAGLLFGASMTDQSAVLLWSIIMLYMFAFMPTLALSSAVALRHLPDGPRQFPAVRLFGTLGWIATGLLVGSLTAEATALPLQIAAGLSLVLGLFSLTLPQSAPPATDGRARPSLGVLLGLDVLALQRSREFWIFIIAALAMCIPLAFYYAYTNLFLTDIGVERAAAVQTLGQVSEIVFLLALPALMARFGIKWILLAGMLAWALRYALFALGASDPIMWMVISGILLHGICYDFFFVAGQIHVDRCFAPEHRVTAQSFFAVVTLGIGTVLGNLLANMVFVANSTEAGSRDWITIWAVPALLAVATAAVFLLSFRAREEKADATVA